MRRRTTIVCVGVALPAATIAAQSCAPATQVTLDLRTNVNCTESRGAEIVVSSETHTAEERAALLPGVTTRFPSAATAACANGPAPHEIGTLVMTPESGTGAVVVVSAFGGAALNDCTSVRFAKTCIVARRRFTFADQESLKLPIVLDPDCAGIPCNESSTCFHSKCVSSDVDCSSGTCGDPGALPDGGPAPEVDAPSPILDGGTGIDAEGGGPGGDDAASDAGLDGTTDGGLVTRACPRPTCNAESGGAMTCNGGDECCYVGPPTCKASGACGGGVSACCRDITDCDNGDVCCATSLMGEAGTGTVIECKPLGMCTGDSTVVCSVKDTKCRGPADTAYSCTQKKAYTWSATPTGYFFCDS
jgi:hypothetical protein